MRELHPAFPSLADKSLLLSLLSRSDLLHITGGADSATGALASQLRPKRARKAARRPASSSSKFISLLLDGFQIRELRVPTACGTVDGGGRGGAVGEGAAVGEGNELGESVGPLRTAEKCSMTAL